MAKICSPPAAEDFIYSFFGTSNIYNFFNLLIDKKEYEHILEILDVTRPTLRRWIKAETAPFLDQFFHLLHLKNRLADFIEKSKVHFQMTLEKNHSFLEKKQTTIHYQYPWAIFLKHYIFALTAKEKFYRIGDLSTFFQIDPSDELKVINEFKKLEIVTVEMNSVYANLENEIEFFYPVSTKDDFKKNILTKKYYLNLGVDILLDKNTKKLDSSPKVATGIFSLNLSEAEEKSLNEKITKLFSEMTKLTDSNRKKEKRDKARIFQIQILDF